MLEPLPHTVYFVCFLPPSDWHRVSSALQEIDAKNLSADDIVDHIFYEKISIYSTQKPSGITFGVFAWIIQTYIQLKKRGLDVRLVRDFVPGKICIITTDHLSIKTYGFGSFVIACQQDRGRPEICEHRIVQNKLNIVDTHTDHYIPHWPQPNIVPRHESRGDRITTLSYKGVFINLAPAFRSPEFIQALDKLQIKFDADINDNLRGKQAWDRWRDYADADGVLAVRAADQYVLSIKPPTKLINAWLAGSIPILGVEPAYRQLRQSELDYFEVESPQDTIAVLEKLRNEPGLFRAVLANGQKRSKEYGAGSTAKAWRDLLAGPISDAYQRWRKESIFAKVTKRPIQYARKYQLHKRYIQEHREQVQRYTDRVQ